VSRNRAHKRIVSWRRRGEARDHGFSLAAKRGGRENHAVVISRNHDFPVLLFVSVSQKGLHGARLEKDPIMRVTDDLPAMMKTQADLGPSDTSQSIRYKSQFVPVAGNSQLNRFAARVYRLRKGPRACRKDHEQRTPAAVHR
jgi:hypothetical protein